LLQLEKIKEIRIKFQMFWNDVSSVFEAIEEIVNGEFIKKIEKTSKI
jgi:hypothetical protein